MRTRLYLLLFLLPALVLSPSSALAQDTATLFTQRCGSCHTIGQGRRVGPDLAGVVGRRDRAWLARMIAEPSKLLDSDPVAMQLLRESNNTRMPDLGLDAATVQSLIAYLERCSSGGCAAGSTGVRPVREARASDVALGRSLFVGDVSFANGGPSCVSCHRVDGVGGLGGGTLAKDLTQVFPRLGEPALDAALTGTPFPPMNEVYLGRALTPREVFALKAYFAEVSRTPPQPSDQWAFPLLGLAGLVVGLVLINATWRNRLRGVRKPLVRARPRPRRSP